MRRSSQSSNLGPLSGVGFLGGAGGCSRLRDVDARSAMAGSMQCTALSVITPARTVWIKGFHDGSASSTGALAAFEVNSNRLRRRASFRRPLRGRSGIGLIDGLTALRYRLGALENVMRLDPSFPHSLLRLFRSGCSCSGGDGNPEDVSLSAELIDFGVVIAGSTCTRTLDLTNGTPERATFSGYRVTEGGAVFAPGDVPATLAASTTLRLRWCTRRRRRAFRTTA